MSKIGPTPAQKAAIESRGGALLVSAGAGSGKTRVLTERLLSYLTDKDDPKDIDSFLVITFTRAAAGELKGRIMAEITAAAAADPSNRRLRRQSALLRRAHIDTIHGFCTDLLRRYGHTLGLVPDFRIVEDDRAEQMKAAALERVMEKHYAAPDEYPGFLALADTVGEGQDDGQLSALVLELHKKMQCHARPRRWADGVVELLRAPASDMAGTIWGKELMGELARTADYWAAEMERVLALMSGDEKLRKAYGECIESAAETLRGFSRALALGWDAARERLPIRFKGFKRLKDEDKSELSDYVTSRRDDCKKACLKMKDALLKSSAETLADMALTHDAMEALLRLTIDFDEEYDKSKKRASMLDFSDLEHLAVRLLTEEDGSPGPLAAQIAGQYTEIMVDEYQDVSRVQEALFTAVSKAGKNLFFVGDVKQAIYRFRLADPGIFTEKYDAYADFGRAAEGEPRRILLSENFRSRREIIDGVNAVFSACMSKELGDVDYDDAAALRFGAKYYPGEGEKPELMLLAAPTAAEGEEAPGLLEYEAAAVARRIEELVRSRMIVTTKDGPREIEYRDVAILLRKVRDGVAAVFRRALVHRGIPVAAARGGEFFDSPEVSAVLDLLTIVDNPHQDVPLIAALRSPCFGFSADALSAIRTADRKSDFYDALRRRAEDDEKCRAFLARLDALRAVAPDIGCAELVWQIINEFDLLAVAGVTEDGEQRRNNLLQLVSLSEEFEATGWRGLHRFVLWLRRLAEGRQEKDAAPGEGVQIMTVHKSKGLEFPVVFLCNLQRQFNTKELGARVLVHPELGLGATITDLDRRVSYSSPAQTAIRARLSREMRSEQMRLLYVAMTRAKERLFMSACVRNPAKTVAELRMQARTPLAADLLGGANSPLVWLLLACLADGEEHLRLTIADGPQAEEEHSGAEEREIPADEAFRAELERKLAFRYPHAEAESLPSKVTATELKDRAETDEDAASIAPRRARSFRMPDFAREDKPLSGAARGTATHLVLQYMDFAQTGSEEAVRTEIERMRAARYLSDREAVAVDAQAIVKLFASPLGRRMLGAETLRREFKFSLLCPADELLGAAADDEVLLQGVVDCCFEEDGELVIVDYKTDAVRTEEQLAERRALYAPQLRAYAKACERIFKKRVKECELYFLSAGRAARVEI